MHTLVLIRPNKSIVAPKDKELIISSNLEDLVTKAKKIYRKRVQMLNREEKLSYTGYVYKGDRRQDVISEDDEETPVLVLRHHLPYGRMNAILDVQITEGDN